MLNMLWHLKMPPIECSMCFVEQITIARKGVNHLTPPVSLSAMKWGRGLG